MSCLVSLDLWKAEKILKRFDGRLIVLKESSNLILPLLNSTLYCCRIRTCGVTVDFLHTHGLVCVCVCVCV